MKIEQIEYAVGESYKDDSGFVYECIAIPKCTVMGERPVLMGKIFDRRGLAFVVGNKNFLIHPAGHGAGGQIVGKYKRPVTLEHWFFFYKYHPESAEPTAMICGPYSSEALAKEYMKGYKCAFGLQKVSAVVPW